MEIWIFCKTKHIIYIVTFEVDVLFTSDTFKENKHWNMSSL